MSEAPVTVLEIAYTRVHGGNCSYNIHINHITKETVDLMQCISMLTMSRADIVIKVIRSLCQFWTCDDLIRSVMDIHFHL